MKKTLLYLILLLTAVTARAQGGGYGYNAGAGGYGNAYSGMQVMPACNMSAVLTSMNQAWFESEKLTIARNATLSYYLSCEQVAQVMGAFDFESTRMDYATEAWPLCVNPAQVYVIYDAFDFELSIDEFNRKIGLTSQAHGHAHGHGHASTYVSVSHHSNVGVNYGASCSYCGTAGCNGSCYVAPAVVACSYCGTVGCNGSCYVPPPPAPPACGQCGVVGCNGNCYVAPAPSVIVCSYCGIAGCNGSCYVAPAPAACGHCGHMGCNGACYVAPVCDDFESVLQSIREKSFDSSRLTVARQVTQSRRLTCMQIRRIMELFSFESTRLEYAKFAYAYAYDPYNYYQVNDAFTFQSSIRELDEHLMAYR